jgi:hypothetical protein
MHPSKKFVYRSGRSIRFAKFTRQSSLVFRSRDFRFAVVYKRYGYEECDLLRE